MRQALTLIVTVVCVSVFSGRVLGAPAQSEAARAVKRLRENKPYAYQEVIAAGEPAVDGLAEILADKTLRETLRFTAANALGEIKSKKGVQPLLKALKDPHFNVRRCAALALGKIGDERARSPLMKLAREDPFSWRDPETGKVRYLVREDARKALEMLPARPAPLRGALAGALKRFRENRAENYQDVVAAGEAAVDGLAGILGDKTLDEIVRFMAANALGDIKSKKGVQPLLKALQDPHFNVRRCAALALGKIGDESARSALLKLAREDRFRWRDPKTGKVRYLVREDARKALEILSGRATPETAGLRKEKEIFLEDASKVPPSPVKVRLRSLSWPFKKSFRDQNVWNNYQQPAGMSVHGALDFIQRAGTEVLAVEDGYVAAIATNYPDWKTHHFFIVTPEKNGDEGWCYTHVDTDSYTFKVGGRVRRGEVLGKVVDFYVGKNKGADHLHLHYVRFEKTPAGKVEMQSLVDPLLFFDWEDTASPRIDAQFHFVRYGTLDEFPIPAGGIPTVSGAVDIIVGISDTAYRNHPCNWMVPVITLEITGEKVNPWRKLVLDQRGTVEVKFSTSALYVSHRDAQRWKKGRPRFPSVYFVKVTHTDGDGVIERADGLQRWDTAQRAEKGQPRFPNGLYKVTVRAWDLKGNQAARTVTVRVANP